MNKEWILDEEEEEKDVDADPLCPNIWVSKEEKRRLRRPWKFSLIIKLLGRTIGFKTLQAKISELWKPKATLNLVAMNNGFFLVKFFSIEDYEFLKYRGPWLIFNHYLIMKPWKPNFDTEHENLQFFFLDKNPMLVN